MTQIWIVDRDARRQAAIARLAAAPESAVAGAPGDPYFDTAPPAEVVLLGLAGDLEAELGFAHRALARLPAAGWVLLAERSLHEAARRLFDCLDVEILRYPPDPELLRAHIRAAAGGGTPAPLPLSQRPARDLLADRFSRWFADLELPELLRALDPRLRDVPLLIRGEPGTGRGLLARYVHLFGGGGTGAFGPVPCSEQTSSRQLLGEIAAVGDGGRTQAGCTLWLEDPDRLPGAVQRLLRGWVEFGPPEGALASHRVRWIATTADASALDPGLRLALSGIAIEIPPLRERPLAVVRFANEHTRAWCMARQVPPRRLGEDALAVLEEYPWPGNLRELEAVVNETLSTGATEPIGASDLMYRGEPFAPVDAGDFGVILEEERSPAAGPLPGPAPDPAQGGTDAGVAAGAATSAAGPSGPETPSGEPTQPPGPAEPETSPRPGPLAGDEALRKLVGAVAHEVRNPLATIRTFAQLLPQRWQEPEFRSRFTELVDQGVVRIEEVIERLAELAALAPPEPEPVDVAECLEELLDEHRDTIRARNLLVLKELDTTRSYALGDPAQIRFAFAGVVSKSLEFVPERGDVYFASKHHGSGLRGGPSLRVLVRFQGSVSLPRAAGTSPTENALEFVLAEAMIRAQNGSFAIDTTDANETVILIDLPAPQD